MRHASTASTVTTIQEALPGLDGALSTWKERSGISEYIDQKIRQWFYETTKAWLAAGGSREALERRISSLERVIRDCFRDELDYQMELVRKAKAEAAGKSDDMDTHFVMELLASEPSIQFASAWLKQHTPKS